MTLVVLPVVRRCLFGLFALLSAGALSPYCTKSQQRFVSINFPGALSTGAWGINNSGQIVGWHSPNGLAVNGFILDQGVIRTIAFPGAFDTRAYGINNAGQIVGTYGGFGGNHGFLLNRGVFSTIDYPGVPCGLWFYGINDVGQIVGYYAPDSDTQNGFVLERGIHQGPRRSAPRHQQRGAEGWGLLRWKRLLCSGRIVLL